MHDAADDAAIVHPLDAPDIPRQLRFDPLPLLIVQPKQVPAHDPNPLPKTNQDRIVRAEKLMSSDPSSCLMLMIWSSRARNRSPDPVVSCFFGRIAPSDAATESCFSIRGNRENEFASFQGLRHGKLAISSQQSRQKTTLAQWVRNSSRATIE
jgi:hypothetical protein